MIQAYCEGLVQKYKTDNSILFVQISQIDITVFDNKTALNKGYYIFPPTGLQYLYEAAKDKISRASILDINFEILKKVHKEPDFEPTKWIEILEDKVKKEKPSIIAVSCLFDFSIEDFIAALEFLKSIDTAIVVVGGIVATYEWKMLLERKLAHFVLRGEGENKLGQLLDMLFENYYKKEPVEGICFLDNGTPVCTVGAPDIVSFDFDLISSYSLVPIEEYHLYGSLNPFSKRFQDTPFAVIQRGRGCRAHCTFCSVGDFMGHAVRRRSIEKIIAEMDFLITAKNVRHFEWLDDDLLFKKDEAKDLFRAIIAKQWNITWSANNGLIARSIDEEMFDLIEKSGCIGFKIGVETGNEEMLKAVRKPAKLGDFIDLSNIARKHQKVFVGANFLVGLPEETFSMMLDSFKFSIKLKFDWAALTVCQPVRGASAFAEQIEYFEEQFKANGANKQNFIPTRTVNAGHLDDFGQIAKNLDIFYLEPNTVPSAEQVKEIWFTFNLLTNFVFNANLIESGNPVKFIEWVETAHRSYPRNAYMPFFLSLAHMLIGDNNLSSFFYVLTKENIESDRYWMDRFEKFYLLDIMNNFPKTASEARVSIGVLQSIIEKKICIF